MTRYAAMFERCAAANEGAFGAFLMLGDPDLATSATLLDALVDGGADMVELGIPFSDPVADGPVIQAASVRALAAGVRTQHCLDLLAAFESCHALAHALKLAGERDDQPVLLVNLSGRGDKDMAQAQTLLGGKA